MSSTKIHVLNKKRPRGTFIPAVRRVLNAAPTSSISPRRLAATPSGARLKRRKQKKSNKVKPSQGRSSASVAKVRSTASKRRSTNARSKVPASGSLSQRRQPSNHPQSPNPAPPLAASTSTPASMLRAEGILRQSPPTRVPSSDLAFWRSLNGVERGSLAFMKMLAQGGYSRFQSQAVHLNHHRNGLKYKMKSLDEIHVFKHPEGLGMKLPEDLRVDTILNFINPERIVGVNRGPDRYDMKVKNLVMEHQVKPEEREGTPLNSLTIAASKDPLSEAYEEPAFVRNHSMILKLNETLENINLAGRSNEEIRRIQKLKKIISQEDYRKFLFLSMKGCFTDIHVDLSGTSVHNYIYSGRKDFYVAKPTKENLDLFKNYEKNRVGGNKWLGQLLRGQWKRVPLHAKESIFIPASYIHFVYTIEDTIMLGGNFLLEDALDTQFDMTVFEERLQQLRENHGGDKNTTHLYRSFWPLMTAYAEYVVLQQLNDGVRTPRLLSMAKIFSKRLHSDRKLAPYKIEEVEAIKKKLTKFAKELNEPQQNGSDQSSTSGPPAKKPRTLTKKTGIAKK